MALDAPAVSEQADASSAPPLHRVVSAWGVSCGCGALLAASTTMLVLALLQTLRVAQAAELWGWAALTGLAAAAPVEGFAAFARRRGGWRAAPLLALVPVAFLLLTFVGEAWLSAYAPGDLAGTFARMARVLEDGPGSSSLLKYAAITGALSAPIALARGASARLATTIGVSLPVPCLLIAWSVVREVPARAVNAFPPGGALLLLAFVVSGSGGLWLGDRLEPWLARRWGRVT